MGTGSATIRYDIATPPRARANELGFRQSVRLASQQLREYGIIRKHFTTITQSSFIDLLHILIVGVHIPVSKFSCLCSSLYFHVSFGYTVTSLLSVNSQQVREIADPISQLMSQVHKLLYISQVVMQWLQASWF